MVLHPGPRQRSTASRGGVGRKSYYPGGGAENSLVPGYFTNTQQKSATLPPKTHPTYKLEFSSMGRRGKNTEKHYLQSPGAQSISKAEGKPGR